MNITKLFTTDKNLPFLFFKSETLPKTMEGQTIETSLCLHADTVQPEEERNFWDLFSELEVPETYSEPIHKINKAINEVARRARRSPANLVIMPDATKIDINNRFLQPIDFVACEEAPAGFVYLTYFKFYRRYETNEVLAVDGGLQYFDGGVSYNPNWDKYFIKIRL